MDSYLDSGAASMEAEFPQSQFAGRQKMFGDLSPENVS
jgi:hypothetical protein